MATSADDYLGALQREAQVDSSGAFSVDLERARSTLQRFQLPSADHYVLPLVGCAVTGGADSLSFSCDQHRHIVDIGGLSIDFHAGGPVLNYLLVALTTATRLAGREWFGETWDGRAGSQFSMKTGQLQVLPLTQSPWRPGSARTRLALTLPYPWEDRLMGTARWLAGVGPASDPAAEVLKTYSRYCPVPLQLNSRQLNLERQGHWQQLVVLNRPPLQLRPLTAFRQTTLERDVPFAGYLGLGVGGGGMLVIVDGLLYTLKLPDAPPEFRAILWHSGLQRDLSLLQLVSNDELVKFRQQLSEIWTEFL